MASRKQPEVGDGAALSLNTWQHHKQMATAALCLLSLKSKAVSRDKQDRRKEIKAKVSSSVINTLRWLKGSGRSLSNKLQHIP